MRRSRTKSKKENAGGVVCTPKQRQGQVEELEDIDITPGRETCSEVKCPGVRPIDANDRKDQHGVNAKTESRHRRLDALPDRDRGQQPPK